MAKQSAHGRQPRRPGTPRRRPSASSQVRPPEKPSPTPADSTPEPRAFQLGAVPGATPGRWIDVWKERRPHVELRLTTIPVAGQRAALDELDAALVRLPIENDEDLHVIRLYDEVPVVMASADSPLLAVDELTASDLTGEVLITPGDDVLGPLGLPTVAPAFAPIETTGDAVATVASGVGILVVPMSLARLHHRKDVGLRPLTDGPTSTVALAWRRDRTTDDVEAFVGIVRGRTANSSR